MVVVVVVVVVVIVVVIVVVVWRWYGGDVVSLWCRRFSGVASVVGPVCLGSCRRYCQLIDYGLGNQCHCYLSLQSLVPFPGSLSPSKFPGPKPRAPSDSKIPLPSSVHSRLSHPTGLQPSSSAQQLRESGDGSHSPVSGSHSPITAQQGIPCCRSCDAPRWRRCCRDRATVKRLLVVNRSCAGCGTNCKLCSPAAGCLRVFSPSRCVL